MKVKKGDKKIVTESGIGLLCVIPHNKFIPTHDVDKDKFRKLLFEDDYVESCLDIEYVGLGAEILIAWYGGNKELKKIKKRVRKLWRSCLTKKEESD